MTIPGEWLIVGSVALFLALNGVANACGWDDDGPEPPN